MRYTGRTQIEYIDMQGGTYFVDAELVGGGWKNLACYRNRDQAVECCSQFREWLSRKTAAEAAS